MTTDALTYVPPALRVGDYVTSWDNWEGEIRAIFTTKSGTTKAVIEVTSVRRLIGALKIEPLYHLKRVARPVGMVDEPPTPEPKPDLPVAKPIRYEPEDDGA